MKKLTKQQAQEELQKLNSKKEQLEAIINAPEVNTFQKIKTLEDACKATGKNYKKFIASIKNLSKDTQAFESLKIITEAINGEPAEAWQDWSKGNTQYKYIPWFYHGSDNASEKSTTNTDSFRLTVVDYYYDISLSGAGGRFFFKQREGAEFCGKQFIHLYKDLNLNIK